MKAVLRSLNTVLSANTSLTFQATPNPSAYLINPCFAILCKVLGDFWAFWGGDIFFSKDKINRGKYEMLKI